MKPKPYQDVPSTHLPPPSKPSQKPKAVKKDASTKSSTQDLKRKLAEEDASSNKKIKFSEVQPASFKQIHDQVKLLESRVGNVLDIKKISGRLGKKKKSAALENPYMGHITTEARAVIPNQSMRPERGPLGTGDNKANAVFSSAKEKELKDLFSLANVKLFKGQPGLLQRMPRFSFALKQHVPPLEYKKPAESTLNGLDPARAPISTIDGIFDDMATNATQFGLEAALPSSGLRLATMCSGTEAPLLGMGLMKQALIRQDQISLDVHHIFSAEIEPYKQAYIGRNFSPPVLFRDVTDFCSDADAHTAYGGTAKQPHDVHILVAGSSCVDYSSLNQKRKNWEDEGQSFRTLSGIRSYVERARPNIVILENVKKAPWSSIKPFFEQIGYACNHVLVDTKNYYLPQTRERGYLIALDSTYLTEEFQIEIALAEWGKLMWDFQRRANAPFSDFIYDDDDVELHAAKLDSDSIDASTNNMGWNACRHRYSKLRVEKMYGSKRPMTNWQDNGSCKFPDFGWMKWGKSQRERIWDTLDIEYLRHAGERDYDINYKIRWLELSQNVDRDLDTRRWGIVSCLTPSGIPYLTTRGGPVSGGESLLLQGIPKYALSLTKETSRQLQNLAGNAMSVPVVTAAILSGILAVSHGMKVKGSGRNYFKDFSKHGKLEASLTAPPSDFTSAASSLKQLLARPEIDSPTYVSVDSLEDLDADQILRYASTTLQFCKCEGTSGIKEGPFQICEDCGHTTCKTCGQNPAHSYRDIPVSITDSRELPATFMNMITQALPTILEFGITNGEELARYLNPMEKHRSCKQEFQQAVNLALHSTVHFKHVKRGHFWKITFEGSYSRLELRINRKCQPAAVLESDFFGRKAVEYHWLLFATARTTEPRKPVHDEPVAETDAGGTLREALQHPIARMIPHTTLLNGKWEIMRYTRVDLDIKMVGHDRAPAWERSIGLQDDQYRTLNRATTLEVNLILGKQTSGAEKAGRALTGIYELRPKCGTASNSLHVRREAQIQKRPPMFFFLEPEQLKNEIYDSFVFSTTNHRRGYKEYRMIQAQVDEGWRPYHLPFAPSKSNGTKGSDASKAPSKAKGNPPFRRGKYSCATVQNWVSCDALSMEVPEVMKTQRFWMPSQFEVTMSNEMGCGQASTFMLVELPIKTYKGSNWKPGQQFSIDVAGKVAALDGFRWLLERAAGQVLARTCGPQHVLAEGLSSVSCLICAPKSPSVMYKHVKIASKKKSKTAIERAAEEQSGPPTEQNSEPPAGENDETPNGHNSEPPAEAISETREKDVVKAMENTTEATKYERVLKNRPPPIVAIAHCHEKSAILEIKLNIPTLCHRVLAKLYASQEPPIQQPTINWFLEEDHGHARAPKFQIESFLNNEDETAHAIPRRFSRKLWSRQRQALTWMVRQEVCPCEWQEQEREEVSVPALGCRIDVEARMPKVVRGGVLADEVGGGKTTTSLALVAEMIESLKGKPMPKDSRSIPLDATLILVPAGIMTQWEEEMENCFASDIPVRRLVVKSTRDLLKLKVSTLGKYNVILASWGIFDDLAYWAALEQLCGAPNMPRKPGRALQEWLRKAMADLGTLIYESQGNDGHEIWQRMGRKKHEYDFLEALNKHDPKKRTAFAPLFHAFTFRRIIIDEYTYLKGNSFLAALELKTLAMWLLSGTPPVSTFDAVNTTAKLLKTKLTSEDEEDGCFSFVTAGPQLPTDRTDAEQFQWYNDDRSPAWLRARNRLVDDFIKKFVRKNSSEAAEKIRSVSHHEVSLLSAHEQIVYFEVFQRLMSQNIKFRTKLPKKEEFTGMSRSERLDTTVCISENPEDALLSCCSEVSTIYRDTKPETTPEEMCTPVINHARNVIASLIEDIYENLRECFAYEGARDPNDERFKSNLMANPHFLSFKLRIKNNDVGDKFVAELIDRVMMMAYKRQRMPTIPYMLRIDRAPVEIGQLSDEEEDGDEEDEVNEDEEEGDEDDDELENFKPLTASEKFAVVENDDANGTADHGQKVGATTQKKKEYLAAYVEIFETSKLPRPLFMDKTFPKGCKTEEAKTTISRQRKFRRDDFRVRNDQEKSRSEDMNMVVIDIVNQVRSLRLMQNVRSILCGKQLPACSGCGATDRKLFDLFILGICGHIACRQCLRHVEGRKHNPDGCLDNYCNAPGLQHHLIEASRFKPGHMSVTTSHGSKMDAVTSKIASILEQTPGGKPQTDSIIIFVQLSRVLKALTEALNAKDVLYLDAATVSASVSNTKVEKFRLGKNENIKDPKVLILLIDSVNAAGWNLQRANHVMFVSAYFTPSQSKYEATMTQAIGRAHRFGQSKTVHVYHFLMAKTLEVNIIQDRERKAIVQNSDGTFGLVERTDSEPTTWEGPKMEGAASGAGAVDVA